VRVFVFERVTKNTSVDRRANVGLAAVAHPSSFILFAFPSFDTRTSTQA